MKKVITILCILYLGNFSYSQDIIYKKGNTTLEGKVLEVTLGKIRYYKKELPNGPVFEVSKDDIYKIRFANGHDEVFDMNYNNSLKEFVTNADGTSSLNIGDKFQGGIVFYLDTTRFHGLVVAPLKHLAYAEWGVIRENTGAKYMDDGYKNTNIILQHMKRKGTDYRRTAPFICNSYSQDGYGDWYLPSLNELSLLIKNQGFFEELLVGSYWSSTETNWSDAYTIIIKPQNIYQQSRDKLTSKFIVRCIRKF